MFAFILERLVCDHFEISGIVYVGVNRGTAGDDTDRVKRDDLHRRRANKSPSGLTQLGCVKAVLPR